MCSFLYWWICLYKHCKTCGLLYVYMYEGLWLLKKMKWIEYWMSCLYCIWKIMHTLYIVYTCLFFQCLVANLEGMCWAWIQLEVLFLFCPFALSRCIWLLNIFKVNVVVFPRAFAPYGSLFWSVFTFCFCFVSSHAAGLRQPYWSADINRRWRNRPDFS